MDSNQPVFRVLVTGGSGYLGQFVVQHLASENKQIIATWNSNDVENTSPQSSVQYVKCDLTSQVEVDKIFASKAIHAVVNTAALSQPDVCEANPEKAWSVNVPLALLKAVQQQSIRDGVEAIFIHISTDQVYDGTKQYWKEEDETLPVNSYGKSKLEAEIQIRETWAKHVILRSSIIYGPLAPKPVARKLFVQFVVRGMILEIMVQTIGYMNFLDLLRQMVQEEALRVNKGCKFFVDEFRSPIFVSDLVSAISYFIQGAPHSCLAQTFNAGGPQRLSRADMALAVARHCNFDEERVEVSDSASVKRVAASPPDISMDSTKLASVLPFERQQFSEALKHIF